MEESIKQQYLNRVLKPGLTKEDIEKIVYDFLPIGRIVGKLGDWYVRWYNGKPIVYKLPKANDYNISQTIASISNRASLAAATKIAAALNGIPQLKQVWKKARVEGNCSYRKILRYNKQRLINNSPSEKISLTPEKCHFHSDITMSFNENNKTSRVFLNPGGFSVNYNTLVVVLFAYDPIKKSDVSFEIINLWNSSPVTGITLTAEQKEICSRYNKYLICTAAIRNNDQNITWSDTVVIKGIFGHCKESITSELFFLVLLSELSRISQYSTHPPKFRFNTHSPPLYRIMTDNCTLR